MNDTITPKITETSHIAVCNGPPEMCWPTVNKVPEPDTAWLLAVACAAAWLISKRRK